MSDPKSRAYAERQQRRQDRDRDELREVYQQLLLGAALRREVHALAKDAGKLAEQATGAGRVAETAKPKLAARVALARQLHATAQRFDVVDQLQLLELAGDDVAALNLDDDSDA